ncbi:MAG TPA: hypothetical protein VIV12_21155 [Streptosporangiaceae bacterium]
MGQLGGQHLERRRAAVLSWLAWCRERGHDAPAVPAWAKRLAVPDSETPARSKMAIDRLIARREVHLREKTFYRMLYETAARAEEILGLNIEELDLAGRRAPVKAKGARAKTRRRGQARKDFVLETVYWDAGTARLLPRLLKGRTRGTGPPLLRPGPRPAGRAHRGARARNELGPARVPPLRPDPPRGTGRLPADAHGEVPAQEAGERPPLLQAVAGGDRRDHQPARTRRRPAVTGRPASSFGAGRVLGSFPLLLTRGGVWAASRRTRRPAPRLPPAHRGPRSSAS